MARLLQGMRPLAADDAGANALSPPHERALARALEPVPLRRQDVDLLLVAIERLKYEATIVLAGDSVTQDVAKTHRLGAPDMVANLTTNKASGVVGLRLLLDRYLARHEPPAHLVIAATPEFLGYEPEGRAAKIYVSSVFRRPEEQALLARFIPPESWRGRAVSNSAKPTRRM